jgi:hypothetical protein
MFAIIDVKTKLVNGTIKNELFISSVALSIQPLLQTSSSSSSLSL